VDSACGRGRPGTTRRQSCQGSRDRRWQSRRPPAGRDCRGDDERDRSYACRATRRGPTNQGSRPGPRDDQRHCVAADRSAEHPRPGQPNGPMPRQNDPARQPSRHHAVPLQRHKSRPAPNVEHGPPAQIRETQGRKLRRENLTGLVSRGDDTVTQVDRVEPKRVSRRLLTQRLVRCGPAVTPGYARVRATAAKTHGGMIPSWSPRRHVREPDVGASLPQRLAPTITFSREHQAGARAPSAAHHRGHAPHEPARTARASTSTPAPTQPPEMARPRLELRPWGVRRVHGPSRRAPASSRVDALDATDGADSTTSSTTSRRGVIATPALVCERARSSREEVDPDWPARRDFMAKVLDRRDLRSRASECTATRGRRRALSTSS
jgi:hypothetical protein